MYGTPCCGVVTSAALNSQHMFLLQGQKATAVALSASAECLGRIRASISRYQIPCVKSHWSSSLEASSSWSLEAQKVEVPEVPMLLDAFSLCTHWMCAKTMIYTCACLLFPVQFPCRLQERAGTRNNGPIWMLAKVPRWHSEKHWCKPF